MIGKKWAAALTGALACTPLLAFGAGSQVQLYGNVDAGIERIGFDGTSINRLGSGIYLPDLLGVRGTEDLGGGLKVFFQAETGFCGNGNGTMAPGNSPYGGGGQGAQANNANPSDFCTGGGFMGRETKLGISGTMGSLAMGRLATPSFVAALITDPFGAGMTGAMFNIDPAFPIYVYQSQSLDYSTPRMDGVQGSMLVGLGGQPGNASSGRLYDLSVDYASGPVLFGVAYLRHNFTASGPVPTAALMLDATGRSIDPSGGYFRNVFTQVFGSYDFGVAKLDAYFAQERFGDGAAMSDGSSSPDFRVWRLGATIPMRGGSVLASFGDRRDANLANSTVRMYALGYDYPMSKQTSLYASYAWLHNGANTDQYVGDTTITGSGSLGGHDASGLALGIQHSF